MRSRFKIGRIILSERRIKGLQALRNREYSTLREICDNPDFDEDLSLYEMLDTLPYVKIRYISDMLWMYETATR